MVRTELAHYRKQLQSLAARLGGQVANLRDEAFRMADGGSDVANSTAVIDSADQADYDSQEVKTVQLLGTEQELFADVKAALDRIKNGTFGHCQTCGGAITKARLEALPYARFCLTCAETNEPP